LRAGARRRDQRPRHDRRGRVDQAVLPVQPRVRGGTRETRDAAGSARRDDGTMSVDLEAIIHEPLVLGDPPYFVGPDRLPYFAVFRRAGAITTTLVELATRATNEGLGADPPQQLFFNAPPDVLNRLTWFFPRHYAIMGTDHPLKYFPLEA